MEETERYALSPTQGRIAALERRQKAPVYLVEGLFSLEGAVDADSLQARIETVFRKYEILRTRFDRMKGMDQPLQLVSSRVDYRFDRRRLEGRDLADPEPLIEELRSKWRRHCRSTTDFPLISIALLEGSSHPSFVYGAIPAFLGDATTLRLAMAEILEAPTSNPLAGAEEEEVLQFADLAAWKHALFEEEGAEEGFSYWRKRLRRAEPGRRLPFVSDPSGDEAMLFDPVVCRSGIDVSRETAAALADRLGVSFEVILLACWHELLQRYLETRQPLLGVSVDSRNQVELSQALGPLTDVLPLVLESRQGETAAQFLLRLSQELESLAAWQDLFTWDHFDGSNGEAPQPHCCWNAFEFLQTSDGLQDNGLQATCRHLRSDTDRYDVKLSCRADSRRFVARFYFDRIRIDERDVDRLAAGLRHLLEEIGEQAQAPMEAMKLASAASLSASYRDFNGDPSAIDEAQPLVTEMFQAQAKAWPDAIALSQGASFLCYRVLDRLSDAWARHLSGLGVNADSVVGISLPRTMEQVVALLSVLKAGGAYLPLSSQDPQERIASILSSAGCRIVISPTDRADFFAQTGVQVLTPDFLNLPVEDPVASKPTGLTPLNLAYVLFTSGSTGQPKGVMLPHKALSNYLHWAGRNYLSRGGQGSFVHSPLSFDFTVTSLWLPLISGRSVLLLDEARGVEGIVGALCKGSCFDVAKLTPAHLRALQHLEAEVHPQATATLVMGGEALSKRDFDGWNPNADVRIVNEYGPTETTVGCCVYSFRPSELGESLQDGLPIGKPISGIRILLLDGAGELAPPGLKGEVAIAGLGLARCYADRPDLTAQAFIPDAWGDGGGERIYRSGDRARLLADGNLVFLGRADDQIKLHGYRIELEEIASAAREHPSVLEAAALPVEEGDETSIVLWARFKGSSASDGEGLKAFLAKRLPGFMLPSAIEPAESIPLTKQGKVDRRQLLSHRSRQQAVHAPLSMPSTREERILLEVWREVLPQAARGIDDNFFRLGGDSIRSIRLLGKARKRGLQLELADIVRHPTVRELAQCVQRGETEAFLEERSRPFALLTESDRASLPVEVEDAYPMTSMQEGMLFHSEMEARGAVYHDIVGVHLAAPYDAASLRQALEGVIAAHPILRTSFDLLSFSRPLQLVHHQGVLELGEESIEDLSPERQQAEVLDWMEREKRRGFQWSKLPLIRFFVHRRSAETFHFSLSFHHSLLDGWSTANLLTEIFGRYFSSLGRISRPLAPAPASLMRDFVVVEERERLSQPAQDFWRRQLEDAPPTLCSGLLECEPEERSNVVRLQTEFPSALAQKANALSCELGVGLKSVLMAAHLNVISLISGNRDMVTGLVSNGRLDQTDGDRVLGLFLNTLPFRYRLPQGTWKELVAAVFAAEAECLAHRRFPLAEINRRLNTAELFNTAFNFVHYHIYQDLERLEGVEVLDSTNFEQTSFTLLANFSYSGSTEAVSLFLDIDASRLSPQQIARIQGYYGRALQLLAETPDDRCDPQLLVDEKERSQLLDHLAPGPGTPFPVMRLERLFEEQAVRRPDAVALAGDDCQLTYRELNGRANRLAWRLRQLGVGLDDVVGVSLPRSTQLLIACLAVQKAGGAFCFLDRDFPAQRLAHMAADTAASVILTDDQAEGAFAESSGSRIEVLSRDDSGLHNLPAVNPPSAGGLEHLCYVVYTSGSTGVPKGIAMTHRVLAELISWQLSDFSSPSPARVVQYTALSFDVSFQEIFSTWAQGGTLVLMSDAIRQHPQELWKCLRRHEVQRLFAPFAGLKQLSDIFKGNPRDSLPLEEILTAGEQVRITPEIESFFQNHPNTALWNQYGPAEAHVVTSGRLRDSIEKWPRLPDIGKPVANACTYILDEDGQPAPIGVRGELHLGGSLARSYFRRAGLTAERFIPDPFAANGQRLYRTGDWARMREDGAIDFLGRLDHQVKILGYRVELGEVEAVLAQHPSIGDIAVVAVETDAGELVLAAHYAAHSGEQPSRSDLRRFAAARLPGFMVPAFFISREGFPRTTGGKIDRVRLAGQPLEDDESPQDVVEPGSETEERVLEIWKQVLSRETLGVEHDFFRMGGHSLAATRISVAIRNAFALDLPLRAIFESRTVRALSEVIDRELRTAPAQEQAEEDLESILEGIDGFSEESLREILDSGLLESEDSQDCRTEPA